MLDRDKETMPLLENDVLEDGRKDDTIIEMPEVELSHGKFMENHKLLMFESTKISLLSRLKWKKLIKLLLFIFFFGFLVILVSSGIMSNSERRLEKRQHSNSNPPSLTNETKSTQVLGKALNEIQGTLKNATVCQDCAGATKIVYPGNDSVCGNDGGSVNVSTFITKGGCTVTMTCEDEGSVACVQFQSNSSCGCLGTNETTFICSGGILNLISEGVFENQLVPVTAGYCTKKMSSPGICLTGLALNATTQVVNKTMGSVTKLIKDILAGGIGSKTLEQLIPHLTNFANDMVEIAKNGSTSVGDILGGGIDFIKDVDGNIRGIISNFQDEAKNCETKSFLTKLICLTSLAVYIPGKLIPIVSDTIDMLTCK